MIFLHDFWAFLGHFMAFPCQKKEVKKVILSTSQQFLPFIAQAHWPLMACQQLNSLQQGDNDYSSYTIWLFNIAMENHHL